MTDNELGWLRSKPQEGEVLIANDSGQSYIVDDQHWRENVDELTAAGWHRVEETSEGASND